MIRAGEGGYLVDDFERKGYAAIGWREAGDFTAIRTLDQMRERLAQSYPNETRGWVITTAGMTFKFRQTIRPGDRVVTYDPKRREYLVGTIEGEYQFKPGVVPDYCHVRKVKWNGRVRRDSLTLSSRNTLGGTLTIFEPGDAVLRDIEQVQRQDLDRVGADKMNREKTPRSQSGPGESRSHVHSSSSEKETSDNPGTCFVIQPFDKGRFDKRYEDTFSPAIRAAGLEPYRVDQDPASLVPIEDIEAGIRRSDACFAEITTDNPNVWFELGFAIAARKPVVMVCSDERVRFPFDVQHRSIIKYQSESPRDFRELGENITNRLRAAIQNRVRADPAENLPMANPVEALTQYELEALTKIAALGLDGNPVSTIALREEMGRAEFEDIASALAIRGLERKQYIARRSAYDDWNKEYWGFLATDEGLDWLENNQDRVRLKQAPPVPFSKSDLDNLPF